MTDTQATEREPTDRTDEPETGLERVLLMAAVEPRYQEALLNDRQGALTAARAADLELTPAEQSILEAVEPNALRDLSAQLAARVGEPTRRAFIHRALAALTALGVGGAGCKEKPSGSRSAAGRGVEARKPGIPEVMRASREPKLSGMPGVAGPSGGGGGGSNKLVLGRPHSGGVGFTGIRPGRRSKKPRARLLEVTTKGFCDKATTRRVLRRHLQEMTFVYVSVALLTDPKFEASVRLGFSVRPSGRIRKVSLDSKLPKSLDRFGRALRASVKRWNFPKDETGGTLDCKVTVGYRFEVAAP